ncbi:hypothetical protein I7I53_02908 [Histoplasma capsulatum var. duboisii H88]|uniref:Uncharacterized protein n=1 Tax=Ajellomyces capsulatus (strain H88) TaxID=544711 RepID=A0A8A1LNX8_AJEC8|nr:hypothetical protein I7I53_02908 [Histoplasma capsulatum var. duboisii H88]
MCCVGLLLQTVHASSKMVTRHTEHIVIAIVSLVWKATCSSGSRRARRTRNSDSFRQSMPQPQD